MDKKLFLEISALSALLFSFVYIQCHSSWQVQLAAWLMLGGAVYLYRVKKQR